MKHTAIAMLAGLVLGTAGFAADMGGMSMESQPGMRPQQNMQGMMSKDGMMSEKTTTAHGVGVVKAIDLQQHKITFSHGPISEYNWPSMTMTFKVADPKLLNGVSVGQQVAFDLEGDSRAPTVTGIHAHP
ncbi:MAG: copper-binding protein [Betaproteobacteria bacterium]|nr:copper-binding protein [Betaproteobacteria bacterium]